jgi:hypothetical protein
MDERLMASLKQGIQAHYEQRYGQTTVHFDEFLPQTDDTARIQITISKGERFITRYYGVATYLDNRLHLDVTAI